MKSVQRWRYYCDHCKKSGGQRRAIADHEAACTSNPQRKCNLCGIAEHVQEPLAHCLDVLSSAHFELLAEFVEDCPACMLATIRVYRRLHDRWPSWKKHVQGPHAREVHDPNDGWLHVDPSHEIVTDFREYHAREKWMADFDFKKRYAEFIGNNPIQHDEDMYGHY